MTGAQAVDLLMARFGNRTAAGLRANCIAEMAFAQTLLELGAELPWFLKGAQESLTVTAATRAVAVPSGFLREIDEVKMYILDSSGNHEEMTKMDYQELEAHHGFEATDELPTDYALEGAEFLLFPVPTVSTTIVGRFYKAQTAPLDAAMTNNWLTYAPDLLIAMAGEQVAGKILKDPELVPLFISDKQTAMSRMITENNARNEAARTRSMG